ncbi:MAG TPA: metallophosphoesterase [Acidimicrobiia bacterium]|nr:metallophosphoesterase [Acidimicrobiia bacterium]
MTPSPRSAPAPGTDRPPPLAGARRRLATVALLAVTALTGGLTACGDGDDRAVPTTLPTPARPTTTTTPPAGPDAGFTVFGDFGGGPAQVAVANQMEAWVADGHRVDALVTTGDNVYDFGEPEHFEAQLDEPYAELREDGRPFWVTLGNHDVVRGYGDEQLEYLGLPPLPYERRLTGLRLYFLDGNRPNAEQAAWLAERLAEAEDDLTVVSFHQPPYSCGAHGSVASVQQAWGRVFEEHDVDLVLSGHDHLYQRFESAGGVTYVVTGGGGRALYDFREPCEVGVDLMSHAVEHHFVGVEVTGDRLDAAAVADDGRVLDRFSLRRGD